MYQTGPCETSRARWIFNIQSAYTKYIVILPFPGAYTKFVYTPPFG